MMEIIIETSDDLDLKNPELIKVQSDSLDNIPVPETKSAFRVKPFSLPSNKPLKSIFDCKFKLYGCDPEEEGK